MAWQDTSKLLVAHPRFAWRDGMAVAVGNPFRPFVRLGSASAAACNKGGVDVGEYPGLTDWATIGVLLGMLYMTSPWVSVQTDDPHLWCVSWCSDTEYPVWHSQESAWLGEAVALALLEVWGNE
uniref:Uncharacterized protein n=1 Tax=viral metagenome TaxID=1070528 RepID=A0A6M3L033_9ZZZZ